MFDSLINSLNSLSASVQSLSKKELERYIIITLTVSALIFGGIIYYTYTTSLELKTSIRRVGMLANKSMRLFQQYEKLQEEENRLQELLSKHKNFNLKIYFEQFCKQNNITPEPGWDTSTESINDKFEEVILPATFKNQNTQKLVKLLEILDDQNLIYIKNLAIRPEKNAKNISFDITLATKKINKA